MSGTYIPSESEVRAAYVAARCVEDGDIPGQVAQFNAWLAEHDAEVAIWVLEWAAEDEDRLTRERYGNVSAMSKWGAIARGKAERLREMGVNRG